MSRFLVALVCAASPCALHGADFANMTASGDVGVAGHLGIGLPVNATQANVRLLVQDAAYPTSFTGLGTTLGIGNGIPNNSFAKLTFGNNNGNAAAIGAQITGTGSYLYLGTSNAYASGITNSAVVIDPSANIGIGTSAPSGLLHLFSNHADSALMLDQPASPNFDTVIAFREQTTSVWNVGVDQSDASKFKIAAGANWNNLRTVADDFVTITTTGKVGIGATAPASRLSVQDTTYPAAFTGLGTTANIGYNLAYNQFAKLTFGAGTGGIGMTVTGSGSYLHLGTSNNYVNGITGSALVIDPNSHVGIGTTTPSALLDVVTTAQGTDGIVARNTTSGSVRLMPNAGGSNYNPLVQAGDTSLIYTQGGPDTGTLVIGPYTTNATPKGIRIDASGKVGIGGTPFDTLDVNGGATIRGPIVSYSPSGAVYNASNAYTAFGVIAGGTFSLPAIGGSFTANVNQVELRTTTNHPLVLMTNNVERMRIDSTGNVGISAFSGAGAARFNVGLSAGQSSLGTFMMTSDNGWMQFLGNSNNQAYNPLVQPGDKALIYTNGPVDTGRLVIGPWSSVSSPKGIVIDAAGNVGIGKTPTNKLTVAGTISAMEIKVTTTGADYVFADGYRLRSLDEVARYVAAEKHLPEMMPAKAMQDGGMPVSEVVTKQLAKIEELTLYAIHQQQAIDAQQAAQADQQKLIAALREQVAVQQQVLAAVNGRLAALETAGGTQSAK